jgi:proline iminopeptidase
MEVYEYMWGPTEFTATGTLSDFDRIDRLAELDLPTLFVVGEYDEIPVETVLEFRDLVPGSIVEIIDDAGHMVHIDGTAQLNGAVSEFLAGIDPS